MDRRTQRARAVALGIAATLTVAPAARAEIVTITAIGHLLAGTDTPVVGNGGPPAHGAFSAPGGDLKGKAVSFGFTIDTGQGISLPATDPYFGQTAGQFGGAANFAGPVVSAHVIVNGVQLNVAGAADSGVGFAQPNLNTTLAFVEAVDSPTLQFFGTPYDAHSGPSSWDNIAGPVGFETLNAINFFGLAPFGSDPFDPLSGPAVDVAVQEIVALYQTRALRGNFSFMSGIASQGSDWGSPDWVGAGGGPDTSGVAAIDKLYVNGQFIGVPEPAAWTMMLLGFGGLGAALRRRRNALAYAS